MTNRYETKAVNNNLIENKAVNCKVIIPQQIVEEINLYHEHYPNKEWSGPVYYDIVEGSFSEGNLVLRITDLGIADVGSEAYTEYSFENFLKNDYWFEKNATSKWGGLHTHHNMNCFFSGTDNQELTDNTARYIHPEDFYLSVIVNAKGTGQWIARICKRVYSKVNITEERVKRTYLEEFEEKYPWLASRYKQNENGEIVPITEEEPAKMTKVIEKEDFLYTDCILEIEDSPINYQQCLTRLKSFIKLKDNKVTTYKPNNYGTNYAGSNYSNYQNRVNHNPSGQTNTVKTNTIFDEDDEIRYYLSNTIREDFSFLKEFKDNYNNNWTGYSLLNSTGKGTYFESFESVCEDIYGFFEDVKGKVPTVAQLTDIIKRMDRFESRFISTLGNMNRHESDRYIKNRIKHLTAFRDNFLVQYWKELFERNSIKQHGT